MNKRDRENWTRFILELSKRSHKGTSAMEPGPLARDAAELRDLAIRLSRLAERRCNEAMDDATLARVEKSEQRYLDRAAATAASWPVRAKVYHQGDPRGLALYLIFPGDIPKGLTVDNSYTSGLAVPQ